MKILFVVRSAEHFSRYTSILKALSARGHELNILFDKRMSSQSGLRSIEEFKNENAQVNYEGRLFATKDWRRAVLLVVRSLWTYRRFLVLPEQSSFFKDRWRKRHMPPVLRLLVSLPFAKTILKTKSSLRLFERIEKAIRPDPKVIAHIQQYQPDAVVIPIGGMRVLSPMTQYLKAAVALGIPTAAPTPSWDSLTTKASMTVFPDIFLLWNEFHRQRIKEHHGVPSNKVHLIGAHRFDKWFEKNLKPSSSRAEFYAKYQLPTSAPYIEYLGAAAGAARNETWLIRELRKWLDKSEDPLLRNVQIVARPHPSNAAIYDGFLMPGVTILPDKNVPPEVRSSHQLSFDTYYHAAAVTGIFTSAMMEAQIMAKPVIMLLSERYRKTQMEAQHFQDFVQLGSVDIAHNFEEFGALAKKIISGGDDKKEKRQEFVRFYLRPLGLEKSAGEVAVDEIEKLVKSKS